MLEIPPTKDTDAEDVVWGLQTAETLWKRGERIDALVWLRRAAQAAGDANDDDRALQLARRAAELAEWMANAESAPPELDSEDVTPIEVEEGPGPMSLPAGSPAREDGRSSATSVLPAEKVHAGMFDPWSETPANPFLRVTVTTESDDEEIVTSVRPNALSPSRSDSAASPGSSVSGAAASSPPVRSLGSSSKPQSPPKPPPLPPRARPPAPRPSSAESGEVPPSRPPLATTPEIQTPPRVVVDPELPVDGPRMSDPTDADTRKVAAGDALPPQAPHARTLERGGTAPEPSANLPSPDLRARSIPAEVARATDLEGNGALLDAVEAFADLPDDARSAFATAATLHTLSEGEEIGAFALAYVVSGAFDVAATIVDAPAMRLDQGAVLRARGTTEEGVLMRLICADERGVLATWSDAAVDEAFRTIPWVEEDLRAAADKVQTLVGITIGPLGERLDASIRDQIVSRLIMRPLGPSEIVVQAGDPVPGLVLVGVGEIELLKGDAVAGVVGSGEFLFPMEVLGLGTAPATARAGVGGALVMFGDRRVAQELLVTCPPLLEVLAGM